MYHVRFTPEASDDIASLSIPIARRVLKKVRWFAENLDSLTPEPLTGQWQGRFKLRVGAYRVLYTIGHADSEMVIHLVKHRSEVYRQR